MNSGFVDPGEEQEADTFIVSLADALTCVFGAAIALFLIFLVLVKLDPAEASSSDDVDPILRSASLSVFDQTQAQQFAMMAVITAPQCAPLEGFLVNLNQVDAEAWLSEQGAERPGTGRRCQLFLRFANGLTAPVTLRTTRPGNALAIRVLSGPNFTERKVFRVRRWAGSGPRDVLRLTPDGDIRFEDDL